MVIGELAAGRLLRRDETLLRRDETLLHLQKLPRGDEIDLGEGLHLLAEHRLWGRGLSWSDVQLLAAASIDRLTIWTRDRSLAVIAAELQLAYASKV